MPKSKKVELKPSIHFQFINPFSWSDFTFHPFCIDVYTGKDWKSFEIWILNCLIIFWREV